MIVAPAAVVAGCVVKVSTIAAAGVIVKVALVALPRPEAAAVRVYPAAAFASVTPEKVATPFTAFTVVVPVRVAPPGFAPSASATTPVKDEAVLPFASRAVTTIDGAIPAPAVVLDGCVVKTRVAGAPALTVNGALVAPVSPLLPATSVMPVPGALTERSANRATPFTAVTVAVPPSVAPAGLLPSAMVMAPVNALAGLPKLSCASTATDGEMTTPAFVGEG